MSDKKCNVAKSLTGDMYAVTKFQKDGVTTDDRYKYKIENWDYVVQEVLQSILIPLDVDPGLWSKFINRKAKIVEI
jgi:hypothetical protein